MFLKVQKPRKLLKVELLPKWCYLETEWDAIMSEVFAFGVIDGNYFYYKIER